MNEKSCVRTVSISTKELPEEGRAAIWRELFCDALFEVDIEPMSDQLFRACARSCSVPGLHMMQAFMSPARVTPTGTFIADSHNELVLIVNHFGELVVRSRGQHVVLKDGDAVLTSSEEITNVERSRNGGSCCLTVPRSMFSPSLGDVNALLMQHIPQTAQPLQLLSSYILALLDGKALSGHKLRQSAIAHVYDLIALSLGAYGDVEDMDVARGTRAARLSKAKAYIVDNSGRHDLSVNAVAAHIGVTPRYLQRLFEGDDSTFTSFLLDQRLSRAYRMLCDERYQEDAVSSVAYDVGFSDLSYFNRRFRRLYGMTPSDARAASRHR